MVDQDTAAIIEQMQKRQDQLEKEIQKLKAHISQLEAKLRVYEGPHTPSSSKPLFKKEKKKKEVKRTPSARNKPKTKKGREKGHKGSTLVLESTGEVHDFVTECSTCFHPVVQDDQHHIFSYQTVDLPEEVSVDITTHHVYEASCDHCSSSTVAEKPLKGTIFGPKIAAFYSLLWYKGRVPLRGISSIVSALTDYAFSASTIGNCLGVVANRLEEPVVRIEQDVFRSQQVHIDETGYISNINQRELDWIWSFSTDNEVFYRFRESRAKTELEDIWIDDPGGTIAIVDGWKAYNYFPTRQRCWAHLLRECEDLAKRRGGLAIAVEKQFSNLFHKINRFKKLRPDTINRGIWESAFLELDEIISLIIMDDHSELRKFARKLRNASEDLLQALLYPDLPLTNNLAERCLRPLVIHRKIRGFVASERGKQTLMRHATMFETWNLRGDNPYSELLSILSSSG